MHIYKLTGMLHWSARKSGCILTVRTKPLESNGNKIGPQRHAFILVAFVNAKYKDSTWKCHIHQGLKYYKVTRRIGKM